MLFLFQTLPEEIPVKQFNERKRMISRFIWKGRKLRVHLKTLHLTKEKGGRSLPCLVDYYKVAQLRYLVCWCNDDDAKWKELEPNQLAIPLQSILGDKTTMILHSEN